MGVLIAFLFGAIIGFRLRRGLAAIAAAVAIASFFVLGMLVGPWMLLDLPGAIFGFLAGATLNKSMRRRKQRRLEREMREWEERGLPDFAKLFGPDASDDHKDR